MTDRADSSSSDNSVSVFNATDFELIAARAVQVAAMIGGKDGYARVLAAVEAFAKLDTGLTVSQLADNNLVCVNALMDAAFASMGFGPSRK